MSRYRPTSKHHITPRSRIPDTEDKHTNNIVVLDHAFHSALHFIAENLTKEETLRFLDIVLMANTEWDHIALRALRKRIKAGEE